VRGDWFIALLSSVGGRARGTGGRKEAAAEEPFCRPPRSHGLPCCYLSLIRKAIMREGRPRTAGWCAQGRYAAGGCCAAACELCAVRAVPAKGRHGLWQGSTVLDSCRDSRRHVQTAGDDGRSVTFRRHTKSYSITEIQEWACNEPINENGRESVLCVSFSPARSP
jgi:hypothetical protein